jgi:hypothetical protein
MPNFGEAQFYDVRSTAHDDNEATSAAFLRL